MWTSGTRLGVSAAEHVEVEGVQVWDDLVPHQRQEAKEGRRNRWGDVQGSAYGWEDLSNMACLCSNGEFKPEGRLSPRPAWEVRFFSVQCLHNFYNILSGCVLLASMRTSLPSLWVFLFTAHNLNMAWYWILWMAVCFSDFTLPKQLHKLFF